MTVVNLCSINIGGQLVGREYLIYHEAVFIPNGDSSDDRRPASYVLLVYFQMGMSQPNSVNEELTENDSQVPSEFGPLFRTSPLLDLLGPFYGKGSGIDLVIGLRAARKHTNSRGTVHGGVLAAMADVSLGYVTAFGSDSPKRLVTASLSVDYTGSARIGDWIEARVDWSKLGKTLAFANCYITVGETRIARASAVFSVVRE